MYKFRCIIPTIENSICYVNQSDRRSFYLDIDIIKDKEWIIDQSALHESICALEGYLGYATYYITTSNKNKNDIEYKIILGHQTSFVFFLNNRLFKDVKDNLKEKKKFSIHVHNQDIILNAKAMNLIINFLKETIKKHRLKFLIDCIKCIDLPINNHTNFRMYGSHKGNANTIFNTILKRKKYDDYDIFLLQLTDKGTKQEKLNLFKQHKMENELGIKLKIKKPIQINKWIFNNHHKHKKGIRIASNQFICENINRHHLNNGGILFYYESVINDLKLEEVLCLDPVCKQYGKMQQKITYPKINFSFNHAKSLLKLPFKCIQDLKEIDSLLTNITKNQNVINVKDLVNFM